MDTRSNTRKITPLHDAVVAEDMALMNQLIDEDQLDINIKDSNQHTPLYYAVYMDNAQMCEVLINKGADINARNFIQFTPLHVACEQGHLSCAKVLVDNGADINPLDIKWAASPLIIAAFWNYENIVRFLCSKGASVSGKSAVFGYTPLHLAATRGNLVMVKVLLGSGAEINAKSHNGASAVHLAIANNHKHVFQYLLNKGAHLNTQDNYGESPLHCAISMEQLSTVRTLLEKGVNMLRETNNRDNVIHTASMQNNTDILDLLLSKCSSQINSKNVQQNSPLHLALMDGRKNMANILLKNRADVGLKNAKGETPFDIAKRKDMLESVSNNIDFNCSEIINQIKDIFQKTFPTFDIQSQRTLSVKPKENFMKFFEEKQNERTIFSLVSNIHLYNGHVEYYNVLNKDVKTADISEDMVENICRLYKGKDIPVVYIRCVVVENNLSLSQSGLFCLAIAEDILFKKTSPSCINKTYLLSKQNSLTRALLHGKFREKPVWLQPNIFVPTHSPDTKIYTEKTVQLHCVCNSTKDEKMEKCRVCNQYFHASCIYKESSPHNNQTMSYFLCMKCTFEYSDRNVPSLSRWQQQHEYHAFLSVNQKDTNFVNTILLPELEGKRRFRLFYAPRDAVAGSSFVDAISVGIGASRKCIVILSSNYFSSNEQLNEWGQMLIPWSQWQKIMIIHIEPIETFASRRWTRLPSFSDEWKANFSQEESVKFWNRVQTFLDFR